MGKKSRNKSKKKEVVWPEAVSSNGSNGSSAVAVYGNEGSAIALEDVQKVLEGLGFEKADEIPTEISLPGVIPNGEDVVVDLVVGGTDDCKIISALIEDTPDKLDSYYMHHPDKYVFKNGDDEINLFQMAAYFGATCTAKWLLDTKKFYH